MVRQVVNSLDREPRSLHSTTVTLQRRTHQRSPFFSFYSFNNLNRPLLITVEKEAFKGADTPFSLSVSVWNTHSKTHLRDRVTLPLVLYSILGSRGHHQDLGGVSAEKCPFLPATDRPYLLPFPTRDASWVDELSDSTLDTMLFFLIMTCQPIILSPGSGP